MIIRNILIMATTGSFAYLVAKILCLILKNIISVDFEYKLFCMINAIFFFPIHLVPFRGWTSSKGIFVYLQERQIKLPIFALDEVSYVAIDMYRIIFTIWCLGVVLYIGVRLTKYVYMHKWLMKYNVPHRDKKLVELINQLAMNAGLNSKLRVFYNPLVTSPFIVGLKRPSLVLNELKSDSLELVIKHELLHIKRKDLLFRYLSLIVCGIFWFCPLVYLLKRDLNEYCELSCDCMTLENTSVFQKTKYFRAMLFYATKSSFIQWNFCNFSIIKKKTRLERRIDNMLKKQKSISESKRTFGMACIVTAVLVATIVISVSSSNVYPPRSSAIVETIWGKSKLVENGYKDKNDIPNSIDYTEFEDGRWWWGELEYESVEILKTSGWYKATFKGNLKKVDF